MILDELKGAFVMNIPVNKKEGLESLFTALERSVGKEGALAEAERKIQVLSILYYICHNKRKYEPRVFDSDKIVHEVSEYVGSHFSDDINLLSLSKVFSVSESHLSRKFKEVSGVGLNEYITFVRIMNAEKFLSEGKYSVTEVAAKCGFNDPNYFSTVFKKIKGITPLKFSKSSSV